MYWQKRFDRVNPNKELEEKIKQLEEDKTKSEEEMKMSVAKPAKEQIKEVTVKNSELKFYQFQ